MEIVKMDAESPKKLHYTKERLAHWNGVALKMDSWKGAGALYHRRLKKIFQACVHPGQRILEIGCGQGDLLAALKPTFGVGIDLSDEMIRHAGTKFANLEFIQADIHRLPLDTTFDVIILSDLVNDLWDVEAAFRQLQKVSRPDTRLIINTYSRLWEAPLALARRFGLAKPCLEQNWLTLEDICGLLNLADYEPVHSSEEIIWPFPTPLIESFINRYLVKLWPFTALALTHLIVARSVSASNKRDEQDTVSVIIPARNEAGSIQSIFERTPEMGKETELVFIEGGSSDNTWDEIIRCRDLFPERKCILLKQQGEGKGDAVRLGFAHATGDIFMILDSDLTVPPEMLPRFYDALHSGKGEFINGVRLVYPVEKKAMRFFNLVGNKFFSLAFTWLLGQPIKDTLCGTKALWRDDYLKISNNRAIWGITDPFGDFELLFGAARQKLKIVEIPVRYSDRMYGQTNIHRWRHGWLLIKMALCALRKLKCV